MGWKEQAEGWKLRQERVEAEWKEWMETDITGEEIEYLEKLISFTTEQPWGLYASPDTHVKANEEGWFDIENLDKRMNGDGQGDWSGIDLEGNIMEGHTSPRYLMGSSNNTEELAMFYSGYHPARANMQFIMSARRFLPRILAQMKREKNIT